MIDAETAELAREKLYASVLSDVLDELGHMEHAMLPHVRPIDDALTVFGRARTALYMEMYEVEADINPYELEIGLVDDLKPGDVAVLACPRSHRVAPWGELLSTTARARGAVGCITDGLVRDIRLIRDMQFPVFAGGIGPLDSKGRGMVMRIDVPVECGGVIVNPNDYIFADADGVVVLPATLVEKAIELGFKKVESEDTVRAELERGDKLADVFERHGIL
ncbi:MAG: RraA family protein [Pseudomonadota bacterium]